MFPFAFLTLLVATVTFIVVRGGQDERRIALALVVAAVVTAGNFRLTGHTFGSVQPVLLASEGLVLALCLHIVLRSDRFWPIPIAAFQLATVLSLLTPVIGRNLVSYALGVTQGIWAYLQLVFLVIAVLRTRVAINARPREVP